MGPFYGKIGDFFTAGPVPSAAFQISSRYLTAASIRKKDKTIKRGFVVPIEAGVIEPRFDRKNITGPASFRAALREGLSKINPGRGHAAILIPETSAHIFVFEVENLPQNPEEMAAFVRWKLNKTIPGVCDEALVAFDWRRLDSRFRLIAAAARKAVVREYEEIFEAEGLNPGLVSLPSLGLINCFLEEEGTFLLVNIEPDHVSLVVLRNSVYAFYRQKITGGLLEAQERFEDWAGRIAAEIENTINYLAKKENLKIERVRLRAGPFYGAEGISAILPEVLSVPVVASGEDQAGRFLPIMGLI